ncbi:phospholipid carrier-dependent glycosyltransferase [Leptolyngbya sp. FACHB-36]|uniref:dolichyl-phosphate-mannose--protein mannosyltransferase n=1 Tax=Leptolyngbya sp. FACHB-36 TaxID=2692808 RepID=UPI0016810151|nr:phospholipid carrier-dependent glycosyltransferase [Leptolyngbya sp. FACHB-36]MBD2022412.1 phospholipid carrier-dependent glycosyltransferase [Leptolyngbya sp. FACHB-36]
MTFQKSVARLGWFKIGIVALLLWCLALRFWGLSRFNALVFDEVYFAKFAHEYLARSPVYDGHPPLSKYLIAIGIWIGNALPIGQDTVNGLTGGLYTTWSYRWMNALVGSFIPLVILGIAYRLTRRRSYALIAGWFAGLDGLLLVESRYALTNVYLVLFGLLGIWFLLLALDSQAAGRREAYLVASGVFYGASASVKWNGLWFLLGAYGLWIIAKGVQWVQARRPQVPELLTIPLTANEPESGRSVLSRLPRLKLWQLGLYLGVVPAVFYRLVWIPHMQSNTTASFWELQRQLLDYHARVGGVTAHPYCSPWYTWMFMLRPVAYFYQITAKGAPLPSGNSTASLTTDSVIYDVHAIGNPVLWWLSTLAMVLVLWALVQQILTLLLMNHPTGQWFQQNYRLALSPIERWLVLFLAITYLANLLPWTRVTRCLFLYHYMAASIVSFLALAWIVDRWLCSTQPRLRTMGIAICAGIALAFLFWLPIYLGLPLSPMEFQLRMLLPSWV